MACRKVKMESQEPLKLLWQLNVGLGVIDCSFSATNQIIASGDVNGNVILANYKGEIFSRFSFDMPVWGVDINTDGSLLAVGLASKSPMQGALVIVRSGEVIFHEKYDNPVWDVKIFSDRSLVLATCWSGDLINCNLVSLSTDKVHFNQSLFGISTDKDNIYITASGKGIYMLSLDNLHLSSLVSRSKDACYNNTYNSNLNKVFYGSNANILSSVDLTSKGEKHYKSVLQSISSVEAFGDYLFFGDLSGNLCVSKIESPNLPFLKQSFEDGIWNISIDEANSKVFIACGDGSLYCFAIDLDQLSKIKFIATDFYNIDLSVLQGTKIFISYASENLEEARFLYESLRDINCDPWLDKYKLLPGHDWKYEINQAIKNADFFILCLSTRSVTKRGFIQKEIKEALEILSYVPEGGVYLLPVRLDDCAVPDSISNKQWVDLFSEDGFHKILMAIYLEKQKGK